MSIFSVILSIFLVFSLCSPFHRAMASKFPNTLKDFGYAFNDDGQLRKIAEDGTITDTPYEFQVSSDAEYNQARYEALGEVITEHVYQMLIDAGLHKIYIPSPETATSSFVFGTKTDFKNTNKLLFLIHGSGVVRAGQWARSLIINQSTDHGTQIPYIKRAIEAGFEVLVTNTNHRYRIENGERIYLDGHETPEQHINSVWEQLIDPALDTIDSFAVVAHSYGGVVTLNMATNYPDEFLKKCFAVAFTDSVHYAGSLSNKMLNWFKMNARNYVTSSKPLNTRLGSKSSDIACYSAGHTKHEWTSWACIDALFPYLEEKYEEFCNDGESDDDEDQSDEENDREKGDESSKDQEKTGEEKDAVQEEEEENSINGDRKKDVQEKNDDQSDQDKADGSEGQDIAGDQKNDAQEKADSENDPEESDGQSDPKKPNKREDL